MKEIRRIPWSVAAAVMIITIAAGHGGGAEVGDRNGVLIWLPGTQPGQADTSVSFANCLACHADQVREWAGSMMANATRDPLFNALLSVTTKYSEPLGLDVGEYCLRCHTGSGWLAGRSHPGSVQKLRGSDLEGVNCDFCHRMIDPLAPESTAIVGGVVPGYGNAMYVIQKSQFPVRGARGTAHPFTRTLADSFYRTGEYCGVCHDISNPYLSSDPITTPPHLQFPVERTFSEWKLSWFGTRGEAGSCQSCHMKQKPGVSTSFPPFRFRLDISSHDLTGGNTFSPLATIDTWSDVNTDALREGISRSIELLRAAASLDLSAGRTGDSVIAVVRVVNLTGHKLPTGFTEGRKMVVSVTGRNGKGEIVFRSGTYDTLSGSFLHDPQGKVYEAIVGMTDARAGLLGLQPGPSYHTSLNDTLLFDNRIPPRGFKNSDFRGRRCEPVGYRYSDGQYWDLTRYAMSAEVESVRVTLSYQVASREFIEFLKEENVDNPYDWNDWGSKLYDAWLEHGGPVTMAEAESAVDAAGPVLLPVKEPSIPMEIRLAQNYPNPFNGMTTIEFWISDEGFTDLRIFTITGQEVRIAVNGILPAGVHSAVIDGSRLTTGLYFYRLTVGGVSQTKKFLVIR